MSLENVSVNARPCFNVLSSTCTNSLTSRAVSELLRTTKEHSDNSTHRSLGCARLGHVQHGLKQRHCLRQAQHGRHSSLPCGRGARRWRLDGSKGSVGVCVCETSAMRGAGEAWWLYLDSVSMLAEKSRGKVAVLTAGYSGTALRSCCSSWFIIWGYVRRR